MAKPVLVEIVRKPCTPIPDLIATIGIKTAIVLLIDFVLVRVLGPNAVNRHNDFDLIAGIGCFLGALAATAWLAFQLTLDFRRLAASRRVGRRIRHLRIEK
jgi:hypothetical protein